VVLLTDRLTRSDLLRAMIVGKKRVPADARVEDPRND
ncbi:cytochrome B, partial [Aeromonas hydrophila]